MAHKLKGGSLSSTWYHDGPSPFVRKEISTKLNREYGYVRWYSQLKKLQRYNKLYPDLFPKVLEVGSNDDTAYFDLEYLRGFRDVKSVLVDQSVSEEKLVNAIWKAFDQLHSTTFATATGLTGLYCQEEVKQKLIDACKFDAFAQFNKHDTFVYFDSTVPNLMSFIDRVSDYLNNVRLYTESHTHGNPTLENMMYSPSEDRVMFIDLYEESIIDSDHLDVSQVLQCSNSYYGYINDRTVNVSDNKVWHTLYIPESFVRFNQLFMTSLEKRGFDMKLLGVLEATQFIRMLPFKCAAGEIDKAKFFYVHACYLMNGIFNGIS